MKLTPIFTVIKLITGINIKTKSPGGCTVDGGMNGGGGENGGDPGQGLPVTGPHKFKLLAKLRKW